MRKCFHCCDLKQPFLLSPVVQDWLPEGHLARFVAEVCEQLDLSGILLSYERGDGRGKAAYHPLMLTRLLLYAYCIGVRSSRQIERATRQDLAFRYLAANQQPDHDTIAAFRQEHLQALSSLFTQVLQLCREAKLLRLGMLAVDGTKLQANASRSQSHSYADLQVSEQKLQERMRQLLLEAGQVDAAETVAQVSVDMLPGEYHDTAARLKKIQQAKAVLEERARREAARVKEEQQRATQAGLPQSEAMKKRRQRRQSGVPGAREQANLTDPDSRLMTQKGGFVQGYNAQVAVESESQVVVAALVSQNPDDRNLLLPVLEEARRQQVEPLEVLADAGYWNGEALQAPVLQNTTLWVPPERQRRADQPLPANSPKSAFADSMRERLRTPQGRQTYRRRQAIVEPVFGRIKDARGILRFLLRGLTKVAAEWRLICLTHNLLKLHKQRQQILPPSETPTNPPRRLCSVHACRRLGSRRDRSFARQAGLVARLTERVIQPRNSIESLSNAVATQTVCS